MGGIFSQKCKFDDRFPEQPVLVSRLDGLQGEIYKTSAANLLSRRKGTNQSGIYAACQYRKAKRQVMSRVMRKIDFGIWQKSITGGGLTAPWLLFSRQGAKGQGRRYAARLALDAL